MAKEKEVALRPDIMSTRLDGPSGADRALGALSTRRTRSPSPAKRQPPRPSRQDTVAQPAPAQPIVEPPSMGEESRKAPSEMASASSGLAHPKPEPSSPLVVCITGAPRTGTHLANSILCTSNRAPPMLSEAMPVIDVLAA